MNDHEHGHDEHGHDEHGHDEHGHDDHGHDDHHAADGDAICPVCEMKVSSATSPSREYEGKTYYFCNESCARAFDQEPAEYAVA